MDINYWSQDKVSFECGHQDAWRKNLKKIYENLLLRWQVSSKNAFVLKTDLFDEAQTDHGLIPLVSNSSGRFIGMDLSFNVAARAREKLKCVGTICDVVTSDAKDLAFESNSFDLVLSTSTLDHFLKKEDILKSLLEISRVLKPRGVLIITLDNISNPIIKLRSVLSYTFLKSTKIVSYFVGKSLSMKELIKMLESCGFRVCESVYIDHNPRYFSVRIGSFLQRSGFKKLERVFQETLWRFEGLRNTPLRSLTGYFIAVKALKKEGSYA